jgi:putative YphP/YqiW family bacilliredoxin
MRLGFMYDAEVTKPMEEELTSAGFTALHTADAVDQALKAAQTKTTLVVINSVCGCAAGKARPGVLLSLAEKKHPEQLVTVFAGIDRDATEHMRSKIPFPPSSPSVALFKEGSCVFFLPRQEIEGRDADAIAASLKKAYKKHC